MKIRTGAADAAPVSCVFRGGSQQVLHQGQGGLVGHQDEVGVQLQDGTGGVGGDGTEEAVLHRLGLVGAAGHQQDTLGGHDGTDAHGVSVGGHIFLLLEEAGVGLDGGIGQGDLVGVLHELLGGFVEADVTVGAQTQQLQVGTAHRSDHRVIAGALLLGIGVHTVGDVAVGLIDVHMVEQVGAHEVGVALVMVFVQAHILVQIDGGDLGEVQITGLVLGDQLLIGAYRAAAGGQTEDAVGLQLDLSGDDVGGLAAQILVVFRYDQSHNLVPSF